MDLPKTYNAKDYEDDIYLKWESSGAFRPKKAHGEPFVISMPPPNATGTLHLGHASMLAIQDTLVRFERMNGRETLWVPGTDHAAIATENVVIRMLKEERGIRDPRAELGREKVVEEIQNFVSESQDTIRNQVRKMGASVDWERERYTMEPAMNRVVNEVFERMYNDGLIYRGNRIVNWDPNLQTTVSDDEVKHNEETTNFYTFKYGPFEIGTARPETKFGDKYVVMHPNDERYAKWKHGDTFEAEWINGKVTATVIKDEAVDPAFGTGAMTITPWHDATDFEIAERHNLDKDQIIDFEGKLLPIAGDFAGQHIEFAREKIVKKLESKGLLVSVNDNYLHNISTAERGQGIIEPQIMRQWFIDVNAPVVKWKHKKRSLKEIMRMVIDDGDIEIIPNRFEKVYFNWIDNLRDWCISRQIWWGHRIPVWYKGEEVSVGTHPPADNNRSPDNSEADNQPGWQQDEDTLDTWFSAANWTWATLLDPELAADESIDFEQLLKKSPDFKRYHPTSVLETGYDIIFFWVARMILMTTYATGEVPFKQVYLHGMVKNREGKKMSKSSPETAIDPLEIIAEYGADALRLSMVIGQSPGNDTRLYKEKIAGYRNFCNKLWNVGRFISATVNDDDLSTKPQPKTSADHWILRQLDSTITEVTKSLEQKRLSDAGQAIYRFLWDDLADWYVEANKVTLNAPLLVSVFKDLLALAHPFAPFVSESLWAAVRNDESLLINQSWPKGPKFNESAAANFDTLRSIVGEIRTIEADLSLNENTLYYKESQFLDEHGDFVVKLTNILATTKVDDGKGLHLVTKGVVCWLDINESMLDDYVKTMQAQLEAYANQAAKIDSKLSNKSYVNNAPKAIVAETKHMLLTAQQKANALSNQIHMIKSDVM